MKKCCLSVDSTGEGCYEIYLFFLRIFVNTAGVNSSVFHWKNRQIRLKIENLGCHGNGHAD